MPPARPEAAGKTMDGSWPRATPSDERTEAPNDPIAVAPPAEGRSASVPIEVALGISGEATDALERAEPELAATVTQTPRRA